MTFFRGNNWASWSTFLAFWTFSRRVLPRKFKKYCPNPLNFSLQKHHKDERQWTNFSYSLRGSNIDFFATLDIFQVKFTPWRWGDTLNMMRLLGSKFSFRPQKFSWFWTSPQGKQKKKKKRKRHLFGIP